MWSVQKVINDLDPENRGRETIYLSNTGRFIIPLKNPINSLSPDDIVAMIAAAVAAIIFAPTPQQQLSSIFNQLHLYHHDRTKCIQLWVYIFPKLSGICSGKVHKTDLYLR